MPPNSLGISQLVILFDTGKMFSMLMDGNNSWVEIYLPYGT